MQSEQKTFTSPSFDKSFFLLNLPTVFSVLKNIKTRTNSFLKSSILVLESTLKTALEIQMTNTVRETDAGSELTDKLNGQLSFHLAVKKKAEGKEKAFA